jgi:nucleoporin NDC1
MVTCAILQTVYHYQRDADRLDLGKAKKLSAAGEQQKGAASGSLGNVLAQLPVVLIGCVSQSITTIPVAVLLYHTLLRSTVWSWTLMFMRPFYNMPKTSILPPSWPLDVYVIARCVLAGTLLSFIWASGNTAFSAFMVKAPLKNGKPLTSESKDPNGSLLSGLKSKKLPIKVRPFFRLLIARN